MTLVGFIEIKPPLIVFSISDKWTRRTWIETNLNIFFGNFDFWGVNVVDQNPEGLWIDVDKSNSALVPFLKPGKHRVEVGRACGLENQSKGLKF